MSDLSSSQGGYVRIDLEGVSAHLWNRLGEALADTLADSIGPPVNGLNGVATLESVTTATTVGGDLERQRLVAEIHHLFAEASKKRAEAAVHRADAIAKLLEVVRSLGAAASVAGSEKPVFVFGSNTAAPTQAMVATACTPSRPAPALRPVSRNPGVEVFVSYSHRDERLRDQLAAHLKPLEREGLIATWSDRRINAGGRWAEEIDERLNRARIILLLVSHRFIESDYCSGIEMVRALERNQSGEARVVPVILRPCSWQTAAFGSLNALPQDGRAITDWRNRDKAFAAVAEGIRLLAMELRNGARVAGSGV